MAFRKSTFIRKRVMAVIEARLQAAEKKYEDGTVLIEDKFQEEVRTAAMHRDHSKEKLADELVLTIIS